MNELVGLYVYNCISFCVFFLFFVELLRSYPVLTRKFLLSAGLVLMLQDILRSVNAPPCLVQLRIHDNYMQGVRSLIIGKS